MVARGDLAVEVGDAAVPALQKKMIRMARDANKLTITATQMMESMIENSIPTRAEVFDVANAVLDGTDAVMLSGETASGKYPIEAVQTMARIISSTTEHVEELDYMGDGDTDEAVASSVVETADRVDARAIVAFTESGATARRIARHRPRQPIVALSPYVRTLRAMNFSWGIEAHLAERMEQFHEALPSAQKAVRAASIGKVTKGDRIVISAGLHAFGTSGSTNLLLVEEI
jgi:pyruvate kinase